MEQHFYHRGSNGDIIYSLPTIIACGGNSILYLKQGHLLFLSRLLKLQPYINDVKNRTEIKAPFINLDGYRSIARAKKSQHLAISHLESQGKTYDLTNPWLYNVIPNHISDILINRTARYHGKEDLYWSLLKPFESKCTFVGYEKERNDFAQKYKIDIPFHKTEDALELAQAIKGSKLFIGNQSMAFAVAEAMKHPRCLEAYDYYNNCQPQGNDGYTNLTPELIEKYMEKESV